MKKRFIQELICGCVVICVAVPAFILTFEMPERVFIFPRIASGSLFVFGVALLFTNIFMIKKGSPPNKEAITLTTLRCPLVVYSIIFIYALLIPVLGFFVCTISMMMIFMWYMNVRSIKSFFLCITIMVVFLYFVFAFQLEIPLPEGILL
jgi:hypothetical protein